MEKRYVPHDGLERNHAKRFQNDSINMKTMEKYMKIRKDGTSFSIGNDIPIVSSWNIEQGIEVIDVHFFFFFAFLLSFLSHCCTRLFF